MLNTRELKYILYGDDRLSKTFKQVTNASTKSGRALDVHSKRVKSMKNAFKGAASEIPALGTAARLITNPLMLAGAAVVGIGAGLHDATQKAAEFNSGFRELNNMNLDKTSSEIKKLKKDILGTAFDNGFDSNATTTGFYDIQSITGKYGSEVESIVSKQGEFANVMKADFNSWISGTGKAMANFGFGADELDRFNKSAAATVQVGVTTYDQYAKVNSVWAGSASAANQGYNSANKLFALFTKKTKTVDEAATMVKSAFTDLFKDSSVKAFEKVGIDLFNVNGEAKQVDQIMKELNKKFASAKSDKAMNALKNEFKGSEGLIALIQTAADQSGDMLRSFDSFDNTSFDFNKALKEAQKDMNYIDNQINNKLKASWIALGDAVLPTWIKIKQIIVDVLDGTKRIVQDAQSILGLGDSANATDYKKNKSKHLDNVYSENKELLTEMRSMNPDVSKFQIDNWGKYRHDAEDSQLAMFAGTDYKKASDLPWEDRMIYEQYSGIAAGYQKLIDEFYRPQKKAGGAPSGATVDDPNLSGNPEISKGLESVSGGGSRVRNIKVDIGSLVDNITIQAASVGEGAAQIRDIIQEELIRAVAGFEQSLG